jgi:predicted Ser/Thr protein kinase
MNPDSQAPPSSQTRETRSRRIGPYLLERELGRGSNGVVYLARHHKRGIEVALKVLLGAHDDEVLKRFRREAMVTSRLQAPGVVRALDFASDSGKHYIAMEYCPGPTLRQRLRTGPFPAEDAARLVATLAETMAEAHQWAVIHRDLKPANIILDPQTQAPRITDFGLARDYASQRMTRTGDILGTPIYMAPEQIRGRRSLDHRVDVYALGVIFYEVLTGRVPYHANTLEEISSLIVAGRAQAPRTLDPKIPAAFEAICLRAMAADADERYPTASALADALRSLTDVPNAREPAAPATTGPRSLSSLSLGLGALTALLAFSLVGMLLYRGSTAEGQRVARAEAFDVLLEEIALQRQEAAPFSALKRQLERATRLAPEGSRESVKELLAKVRESEAAFEGAQRLLSEIEAQTSVPAIENGLKEVEPLISEGLRYEGLRHRLAQAKVNLEERRGLHEALNDLRKENDDRDDRLVEFLDYAETLSDPLRREALFGGLDAVNRWLGQEGRRTEQFLALLKGLIHLRLGQADKATQVFSRLRRTVPEGRLQYLIHELREDGVLGITERKTVIDALRLRHRGPH